MSDKPDEGIFDRFDDYRTVSVLSAVGIERGWQDGKFGVTDHADGVWMPILVEEVGEAALAMNVAQTEPDRREAALDNLEVELIQVAAAAVAWAESLRRRRQGKCAEPAAPAESVPVEKPRRRDRKADKDAIETLRSAYKKLFAIAYERKDERLLALNGVIGDVMLSIERRWL